jgi:ABC-type glutathione transport system ATPase component
LRGRLEPSTIQGIPHGGELYGFAARTLSNPANAPVLREVNELDVRFGMTTPVGKSIVHAVRDVSFSIRRGTTLGLVGEPGSGKSTVAAALARGLLRERASAQRRRALGIAPLSIRATNPSGPRNSDLE